MRIAVANLTKRFGALAAVSDVSLTIDEGELFTLLGPSGCGKTTLLRLIAGFYAPDTGTIANPCTFSASSTCRWLRRSSFRAGLSED